MGRLVSVSSVTTAVMGSVLGEISEIHLIIYLSIL